MPPELEVSFLPMEKVSKNGELSLDDTRELQRVYEGYTYFRDGDVLVAKITPCFENGKGALCAGLVNGIGFGTTEFHVLRPMDEMDAEFLFCLSKSLPFRSTGTALMTGTAGQKRVPESFVKNFRVAMPPIDQQRAIAAFLDRETGKIDALITKKERLMALLEEKRTALISHAVTKGLDPTVPMKDSGIEWLGEIPEHWEVKRLKYVLTFQRGHDLPSDSRMDGNIPVVTSAGPSGWHSRPAAKGPGIVTGRYGTIGTFHLIEEDYWPLNTTLYSIDMHGNIPRYLWYMLHSLTDLFLMNAGKSAVPGVDRNDLHPTPVVVAPLSEQHTIAAFLDRETAKIDGLIAKVREAIEKLREYRTALISACVTGKIDVRDEVAA